MTPSSASHSRARRSSATTWSSRRSSTARSAGVAVGIRDSAEGLRKIQSGFVRQYALAMVLGFAVIIVYLLARVH